ncbi:MAG: SPOR domain-containing protein [Terracidiphilus sp.]
MSGVFDDEELEPEQPRRDTELTLSSMMLLAIFFGLVLICGLCFGLGYSLGHRGSQQALTAGQTSAGAQTTLQADISRPKPSATAPTGAAPEKQSVVVDLPQSATPDAGPAPYAQSSEPVQPQVRPALPAVAGMAPTAQPAKSPSVAPAMAPAGPLMVQIAAVSHQEDADVLVSALRSRGYAVAARREAVDGMIHVRIGPFSSRDAANKWRLKLLGDGYNAVVQP